VWHEYDLVSLIVRGVLSWRQYLNDIFSFFFVNILACSWGHVHGLFWLQDSGWLFRDCRVVEPVSGVWYVYYWQPRRLYQCRCSCHIEELDRVTPCYCKGGELNGAQTTI